MFLKIVVDQKDSVEEVRRAVDILERIGHKVTNKNLEDEQCIHVVLYKGRRKGGGKHTRILKDGSGFAVKQNPEKHHQSFEMAVIHATIEVYRRKGFTPPEALTGYAHKIDCAHEQKRRIRKYVHSR